MRWAPSGRSCERRSSLTRADPSIDAALDLNPTKVSSVKVYVAPG